jgi:hypothetical protein
MPRAERKRVPAQAPSQEAVTRLTMAGKAHTRSPDSSGEKGGRS